MGCGSGKGTPPHRSRGTPRGTVAASERQRTEGQYLFFRYCLESVPAYLRGGDPSVVFDETNAAVWESFLGCAEFRTCRSLLLELMGIEDHPGFRLLDLCYGPGWGLEAAISQFPAIRVTALDFTEVFHEGRWYGSNALKPAIGKWEIRPCRSPGWVPIDGADSVLRFRFPITPSRQCSSPAGIPTSPTICGVKCIERFDAFSHPEGNSGCSPAVMHWLKPGTFRHFGFVSPLWPTILRRVSAQGGKASADVEENMQLFSCAGFRGGVAGLGTMSALQSSLWVLRKCRGHD